MNERRLSDVAHIFVFACRITCSAEAVCVIYAHLLPQMTICVENIRRDSFPVAEYTYKARRSRPGVILCQGIKDTCSVKPMCARFHFACIVPLSISSHKCPHIQRASACPLPARSPHTPDAMRLPHEISSSPHRGCRMRSPRHLPRQPTSPYLLPHLRPHLLPQPSPAALYPCLVPLPSTPPIPTPHSPSSSFPIPLGFDSRTPAAPSTPARGLPRLAPPATLGLT
jgi:hypothetical protein